MATDSRDSRLLSLPAELRNKIYRLVLVEDSEIIIPPWGPLPAPPGLLATNTQIRNEASSIYFQENNFHFVIYESNAVFFLTFRDSSRAQAYHAQISRGIIEPTSPSWENAKIWLRAFYDGRAPNEGD
ncbi:hypothetical protein CLAFUW4_14138 [Fulvia fulva]|uniref:Uncharacterized protein n=1 Tax=Passalora fulva TaxID=5499 RepID=A0A9Q8UWA6_PASFU|nr:uncharacterized protein CLAFUR5_13972 [Fulvia fulva]KAK4610581.1 hypothetical protein CLAFUR4_14141 [Fulvia fulva]KAK4610965.1 hypothetical protein CLAFUR0_14145 [Fulvia fulva]UJO24790.1 hypothetical protein CLAFUR5_13972 [Fulvia fulva]WPV22345.1 hypothetical protein CLAFUW4_14138 [Fulvia fulva]WPV36817.1 hypothetical protein CLAFUW7_14149 [Fulvia fulva]